MINTSSAATGQYEFRELIGRGGMAEVRAGHDTKLGRPVALKRLKRAHSRDDTLRSRFIEEASAAVRLTHPNIVCVYDTGEQDGLPYIVMERLPGTTLADEIHAGPLDVKRVRAIALECLAALDYAHRAGILHRDVKPANILVTDEGHVKLGDFGIADAVEGLAPHKKRMVLGTLLYLAPERAIGEPASEASDLYSLGVVLYEFLTGRPPFVAESTRGILKEIKSTVPTHIRELRDEVDSRLAEAVMRVLSKDPVDRFASAAEMLEATREVVPDHRVTAAIQVTSSDASETRPVPPPRARRTAKSFVLVALISAALVAAAVLLFGSQGDQRHGSEAAAASIAAAAGMNGSLSPELVSALASLERAISLDSEGESEVLLQQRFQTLVAAASASDQDGSRTALADLRMTVQQMRATNTLTAIAAGRLLSFAADVEAQLYTIKPSTTTRSVSPVTNVPRATNVPPAKEKTTAPPEWTTPASSTSTTVANVNPTTEHQRITTTVTDAPPSTTSTTSHNIWLDPNP